MTWHFAGYNGLFPQLPVSPKVALYVSWDSRTLLLTTSLVDKPGRRSFLTGHPAWCSLLEAQHCSNDGCVRDKKPRWSCLHPQNYEDEQTTGSSQPLFFSAVSLSGLWDPQRWSGIPHDSNGALHLYWTGTASVKGAEIKAVCYLPCVSAQAPDL